MRILLVSDNHGDKDVLDQLIIRWPDVNLYLHAGDSLLEAQSIYPFRTVRGNCDYHYDMLEEIIIPTPFGNILMRHKDDVGVNYLKEHQIRIFIYGHTHIKSCVHKNGIAYINPGSLVNPRDEIPSYAILENTKEDVHVTFYSLEDHKPLKRYKIYELKGE